MRARCAIPGAALTQGHYLSTQLSSGEHADHLARFGVRAGLDVLLYIGQADIHNVCVMNFNGRTVSQAIDRVGVTAVADACARVLRPLVDAVRTIGAFPVLYGCLCHDNVKYAIADLLGLRYERCAVCGGKEGAVQYEPGEPRPPETLHEEHAT